MNKIKLYNEDNLELMKRLPDESIDVICIDPPYLYLKNQKLERPFDEHKFFSECRRLLTENGFIVMFGRGESFYRWNTILTDLKFNFKEEIIWDKKNVSSPMNAVSRKHETIAIYCRGKSLLNKIMIPYIEVRKHDLKNIVNDINRIKSALNSDKLDFLIEYLSNSDVIYSYDKKMGHNSTIQGGIKSKCRNVSAISTVIEGFKFQSIIQENKDHYNTIHPTQKPVRLLERLLALVIPESKSREEIIVADFFGGSMSCMEAVHNMGMKGIACEIDQEYFKKGEERIRNLILTNEKRYSTK